MNFVERMELPRSTEGAEFRDTLDTAGEGSIKSEQFLKRSTNYPIEALQFALRRDDGPLRLGLRGEQVALPPAEPRRCTWR